MKSASFKTTLKKNIVLNFALLPLLIGVSCGKGYAMESKRPCLDQEWKWIGAPKLSTGIGMPFLDNPETNEQAVRCIRVAVLDQRLNSNAVDLSESCYTMNYSENDNYDHGTHVADTIKVISPTVSIHNHLGIGPFGNLESALLKVIKKDKVHVINMSLGCNFEEIEGYSKDGQCYNAMMAAAHAGKIMVKTLGNYYQIFEEDQQKFYCETLMVLAEHHNMQGRLILVANADYSKNDDLLETSSNRPHRFCKYVITAPGTDIYACVGVNEYSKYTGTSMAAPIVSGIIAQLLGEYWDQFSWPNLGTNQDFKDIIVMGVLESARSHSLRYGKPLGVEFGCGIVNYEKAKENIKIKLSDLYREKNPRGWALRREMERKNIDRKDAVSNRCLKIIYLYEIYNLADYSVFKQNEYLASWGFDEKQTNTALYKVRQSAETRRREVAQRLEEERLEKEHLSAQKIVTEKRLAEDLAAEIRNIKVLERSSSSGSSSSGSSSSGNSSSGSSSSGCSSSGSSSSRSSSSRSSSSRSSSSGSSSSGSSSSRSSSSRSSSSRSSSSRSSSSGSSSSGSSSSRSSSLRSSSSRSSSSGSSSSGSSSSEG